MKKFISMLLVTAFMLAAFSAFGVPSLAVDDTFDVTGPYFEDHISLETEYSCNFTVEQGGMYIIQTVGFWGTGDESTSVGNGGTITSMTLTNSINDEEVTVDASYGYGNNGFMYVPLSENVQYTLEIEGNGGIGRLSFTNTTGLFEDVPQIWYYYNIYEFVNPVQNPPSFIFDYTNEFEAQVALVTGDGYYHQLSVWGGSGYENAYLIDPRVELHYDGMEEYAGLYNINELGQTEVPLEDGVQYYIVAFFERGFGSILNYMGVETIDVIVRFRRVRPI